MYLSVRAYIPGLTLRHQCPDATDCGIFRRSLDFGRTWTNITILSTSIALGGPIHFVHNEEVGLIAGAMESGEECDLLVATFRPCTAQGPACAGQRVLLSDWLEG